MITPAVVMDPSTPFKRLGPVSRLREFVTPVEDVHVLAHLGVARVDPRQWRLPVDGMVERPFVLDLEELLELPARELTAVFECYGNPLRPDIAARSVANVVWRGAPLAGLLARACPRPQATLVHLEGMDSGTFADVYCERYVKDIPLERALNEDVLVAYAMNGVPLTPAHGFPARAVVPGYFGTNSVKWLSRVSVAAARPEGLFTTHLYNRPVDVGGRERLEPAREMDVNAVIVWPADQDQAPPGRHLVSGWAWSASPIAYVEGSTDRGAPWHEARGRGGPAGVDMDVAALRIRLGRRAGDPRDPRSRYRRPGSGAADHRTQLGPHRHRGRRVIGLSAAIGVRNREPIQTPPSLLR